MRRRLLPPLLVLLAAVGLALCVHLANVHLKVLQGGVSEGLFCGSSRLWNCNQVASHESSWLLGLPLAFWGIAFYILLSGLSIAAVLYRGEDKKSVAALGALLCGLAFAFDLYLGAVMVGGIGALCASCIATYGVNLALCAGFLALVRAIPGRIRWRALLPEWRMLARGADADYYRHLLKAGLAALTAAVAWLVLLEFRIPLRDTLQFGEKQVEAFLEQVRSVPPIEPERFEGQPLTGPRDAPVQLVLMGDFQCSLCRQLARTIEELRAEWPGSIAVAFVNSPLSSECNPGVPVPYHEDACWLARAGECADRQGRFWAYHDFLYEKVPLSQAEKETVLARLEEIGIEREGFLACMDSVQPAEAVAADIDLCYATEVTTTPSMVINGYPKRGTMFPWMLRKIVASLIEGPSIARKPIQHARR
jgi:protein-disulfide isomerase/uncharacterized membrane protein